MPVLTIANGPHSGKRFDFQHDVILGRGAMADLAIDDSTISRRHARLLLTGKDWIISDLRSGNGTMVNGQPVKDPVRLRHGDLVQLGSVQMKFATEVEAQSSDPSVVMFSEADEQSIVQTMEPRGAMAQLLEERPGYSAESASARLQLVYDIGEAIAQTFDEDVLFPMILDKLFETFKQASRGFVMVYDASDNQLLPKAARTRSGASSEIAVSRTLVWQVVDSRKGILSVDAMHDDRFAKAMTVQQLEIRSMVCVPMIAHEELFGLIHVDATDATLPFRKDDMALMLAIANQAAVAVSNARMHKRLLNQQLVEQDLAFAKRIQLRFLPRHPPEVPGYDFKDLYLAAMEVGGDYYDFIALPEGMIGIALGDVSGKGVSGALYMAKLSSDVRYHAAGSTSASDILGAVNESLSEELEEGMFVTMIFFVLDPVSGRVTAANAGHQPPVIRRADGTVEVVEPPRNVPLGVDPERIFDTLDFDLNPGDTVLVYTDGVSEATNVRNEEYGEERILETVMSSGTGPTEIINGLLASVRAFLAGAPQNDDITLVGFGPSARPRTIVTAPRMKTHQIRTS